MRIQAKTETILKTRWLSYLVCFLSIEHHVRNNNCAPQRDFADTVHAIQDKTYSLRFSVKASSGS